MAWKYCGAVGQSWPGGYSLTLDLPQSGQQLILLPALPHTPLLLRLPPRAEVGVVIRPAVRPGASSEEPPGPPDVVVQLFIAQAAPKTRSDFTSPNPYRGRPAASRSGPTPVEEDSPGDHPNPTPTEPVPEQPPAPPGADAGPSQSSSSARHHYRTTIPSKATLARRPDAPTSLLMMKGCLGSLWAESMDQISGAPPLVQMDRFSKSWAKVKDELRAMREERTASEVGYQQQLAHQAQEIQSRDTLLQERGERLEVQAAQLETQVAELRALKAELSQSRAALSGVSTALAVYQEGEEDRCLRSRMSYLTSSEFLSQAGARFSATIPCTAAGVIRQLHA
ncbi:defective chorion-1 protein-like [Zingiber officinale]|uniref:defective chorion-1 protein-like n=1 Tax=Zingiber officinale TaxID=94328 RepID=UPI001C4DAC9F|nr:defective chorion-1 protein-like [Zingiber officinale]